MSGPQRAGPDGGRRTGRRDATLVLLGLSLLCVAVAPLVLPADYSVVRHSVSESAAQGVTGAWVARIGLLALGAAAIVVALPLGRGLRRWSRVALVGYGAGIALTAAAAHRPWRDVPHDAIQDTVHSLAASAGGFAFVVAVVLAAVADARAGRRPAARHVVAAVAATLLPLAMTVLPTVAGLPQRLLFLVGYGWLAAEAAAPTRASSVPSTGADGSVVVADASTTG